MNDPHRPWNAGLSVGKKQPFTPEQLKELYGRLKRDGKTRELAMLTTAVDSMLRASDLLHLKVKIVRDSKGQMRERIHVRQQKTNRRVVCALGSESRDSLLTWIKQKDLQPGDYLFPGRTSRKALCRRQFQDIVKSWVRMLNLPEENYGTHSLRRSKAVIVFSQTHDPSKVQLLLGQSTLAAAQEYLGVTEEEALKIAESIRLFEG